jgi:probable addiction module antidote protein
MTDLTIDTTNWNSAAHLKTDDDMAEYLDACLREGGDDAAFIVHALGVIAQARGIGQEGIYKALSEDGNPSFGTILKVVKALDLQLHATTANA